MINNLARAINVAAFRQKKHYLCPDYTIFAMRKIAFSILFVVCLMFFSSCSFFGFYGRGGPLDLGYINEYGQYVPKRQKYKLKDKKGHILFENLDTINIYRSHYYNENYHTDLIRFIKFYPEGRCLEIFISEKDFDNQLKKDYLNPRSREATIGYYYSKDGKKGLIEFFKGDNQPGLFLSQGGYSHERFFSNSSGDTLFLRQFKIHYIKETIPETWEKYPVDW